MQAALVELAKDPLWFAQTFLRYKHKPISFHPWQTDFIRTTDFLKDRVCLRAARQIGKSLLVSILVLAYSVMHPDCTTHIFSASWRQSGNIFRYITQLIEGSPDIKKRVKGKIGKNEVSFKNGSRITHATAGLDGKHALGYSCEGRGMVVLDECAHVRSEAARQIMPIANNAGLILVSTPQFPSGFFYDASKSEHFKNYHIPAIQSPLYDAQRFGKL